MTDPKLDLFEAVAAAFAILASEPGFATRVAEEHLDEERLAVLASIFLVAGSKRALARSAAAAATLPEASS